MQTTDGAKRKTVQTTVGELIAAIFDVVGDRVDQVVDLLRYEDRSAQPHLIIEDPNHPARGRP